MELSPADISGYVRFIDNFDMLTQNRESGADGGDSTHRFSVAFVALKLLGSKTWLDGKTPLDDYYNKAMLEYEVKKDNYARHPDKSKWYSNPLNFSADQMSRIQQAMLVMKDKERIKGVAKGFIKRFGFNQNIYPNFAVPGDANYKKKVPDVIRPSQIADLIAGLTDSKFATPVLYALDMFKFVDVVLARRDDNISKAKGSRTDYYTMLVMDIIVARAARDNFILKAVAKQLSKDDYKGALKHIFKPGQYINEACDAPLDKLIIPLAERYIDNAG